MKSTMMENMFKMTSKQFIPVNMFQILIFSYY